MPEEKISPGLVIVGGLGLGLAAAVGVYAIAQAAPRVGFSLSLANAPEGAVLWKADFAGQSFDYDPWADSGWLGIDESWVYPSDPRDCTTMGILVIDANDNVLVHVENLGPVSAGKSYVYDCATGELLEV